MASQERVGSARSVVAVSRPFPQATKSRSGRRRLSYSTRNSPPMLAWMVQR